MRIFSILDAQSGAWGPYKKKINEDFWMDNKILLIIASLLLPPLAVFLKVGAGKDLVINIVLCLFFWVPGIIHALWVSLK